MDPGNQTWWQMPELTEPSHRHRSSASVSGPFQPFFLHIQLCTFSINTQHRAQQRDMYEKPVTTLSHCCPVGRLLPHTAVGRARQPAERLHKGGRRQIFKESYPCSTIYVRWRRISSKVPGKVCARVTQSLASACYLCFTCHPI